MKLCDIDKFKSQNPNISISVFVMSNDKHNISPIGIANKMREKNIKLGLLTGENVEAHYFLIRDLSPLVFSQISKYKRKKLIFKSRQSALDKQKLVCQKFEPDHEKFPWGKKFKVYKI